MGPKYEQWAFREPMVVLNVIRMVPKDNLCQDCISIWGGLPAVFEKTPVDRSFVIDLCHGVGPAKSVALVHTMRGSLNNPDFDEPLGTTARDRTILSTAVKVKYPIMNGDEMLDLLKGKFEHYKDVTVVNWPNQNGENEPIGVFKQEKRRKLCVKYAINLEKADNMIPRALHKDHHQAAFERALAEEMKAHKGFRAGPETMSLVSIQDCRDLMEKRDDARKKEDAERKLQALANAGEGHAQRLAELQVTAAQMGAQSNDSRGQLARTAAAAQESARGRGGRQGGRALRIPLESPSLTRVSSRGSTASGGGVYNHNHPGPSLRGLPRFLPLTSQLPHMKCSMALLLLQLLRSVVKLRKLPVNPQGTAQGHHHLEQRVQVQAEARGCLQCLPGQNMLSPTRSLPQMTNHTLTVRL